MNLDNANKWLSVIANFGVVAGIIFLGIEVRQNQELLERDYALARLDSASLDLSRHAANRSFRIQSREVAQLWLDGIAGNELDPVDQSRFMAYNNGYNQGYVQGYYSGLNTNPRQLYHNTVSSNYRGRRPRGRGGRGRGRGGRGRGRGRGGGFGHPSYIGTSPRVNYNTTQHNPSLPVSSIPLSENANTIGQVPLQVPTQQNVFNTPWTVIEEQVHEQTGDVTKQAYILKNPLNVKNVPMVSLPPPTPTPTPPPPPSPIAQVIKLPELEISDTITTDTDTLCPSIELV